MRQRLWSVTFVLVVSMVGCGRVEEQAPRPDPAPRPDLSGMWSDPPSTAVDQFCFIICTDAGITRLNALLDDPANDARPFSELSREAGRHQSETYIRPALAPDVAKAMGASLVKSYGDYRALDQQRRHGQEIWTVLLTILIGLIFLEMILEQVFAKRKA